MPEPPQHSVTRGARMAGVVVKHASRDAVRRVREPFLSDERRAADRDAQVLRLADDLVTTLGTMKGAAMKLGQIISLLNLGLSTAATRDEFTRRLAPLFSQAPAVPDATMFAVIDAELGRNRRHIATIDPGPIAAASLGQVYRGTLTDGRVVAIKVQYPSARHAVRADLKNLALMTKLFERRYRHVDVGLSDVVAEVSDQIRIELDYRRELESHDHVWRAHLDHPVFAIPEPLAELCTDRVLVTEFVDGVALDHLGSAGQEERDRVGEAIYRFYCGTMYSTGAFCADPHPGNVKVLADGRVAFMDFGLYVRMTEAEVSVERGVLAAVMTDDAEEAYRLAKAAGFIVDTSAMSPETTMEYIRTVAGWYLTPGLTRITERLTHQCLSQAMLPGSDFGHAIFRQRMQPAHAFSRRTEMSVLGLLASLHAEGRWHDIAAEWILGRPASTDMGRRIADWQRRAGGSVSTT